MPSARLLFTRKALAAIEPPAERTTYQDTETRGLILDVTVRGIKTFRIYRKVAGKPEKITLGRFNPDLPDSREFPQGFDLLKALMSASELNVRMARRLGEAVNVQLDSGLNPAETKRKARGELSLGQLFTRYIEDYAKPKGVKTIQGTTETFQRYLGQLPDLPAKKHGIKRTKPPFSVNWEHRKLSTITADEVRRLHSAIGKERAGATANRVIELLARLYNKAADWGEFTGKPPTDGQDSFKETKRDRFIVRGEMPAFWKALYEDPSQDFQDLVALSLLAGARKANNHAMRWDEIDMDAHEWRVPDSKNGDPLRVVLVPEAMEILARRRLATTSEWVFPSTESESGHIESMKHRWNALRKRAGLTTLWMHDLRRSLGSWQARTGASMIVIGKSLGHKSQQATEIYARLDTDPVRESVARATAAMLEAGKVKKTADVLELTPGQMGKTRKTG
jgi:integrase